jgi:uncharacterized protein involved in exopolysaccharide biosynthesis
MTILSPNAPQQSNGSSLRDLLHILFKHQAKILIIFIVTVTTVTVRSFLITPIYEANASLLIKIGREYINQPEVGEVQNLMVLNQGDIINSEIQILNNRELIEKVIIAMGVGDLYPRIASDPSARMTPLETAVLQFSKNLTVVRGTNAWCNGYSAITHSLGILILFMSATILFFPPLTAKS